MGEGNMATRTIHQLIDDLDGTSEAAESVRFSVDGVAYEIDLTGEHASEMRAALAPYVGVAQRLGRVDSKGAKIVRTGEASATYEARRDRNGAIRSWFERLSVAQRAELGLPEEMSDRGRIAKPIEDAFDAVKGGLIQPKPAEPAKAQSQADQYIETLKATKATKAAAEAAPEAVEVERPKAVPVKAAKATTAKPAPAKAVPASSLEIRPARRPAKAAKAATKGASVTEIGSAKGARGAASKAAKIAPTVDFSAVQ